MGWVGDDFFDDFGFFVLFGGVALDVGAGDPEAVEEEAGAAGVDFVVGDFVEEERDAELDAAAFGEVGGGGEVEGGGAAGGAGLDLRLAGAGAAGGAVVVAEVLLAEGGAAAADAVGFDVAALVLDGVAVGAEGFRWHWVPLGGGRERFWALLASVLGVVGAKARARLVAGPWWMSIVLVYGIGW